MSYHLYSYVLNQEKLKLNELISKWLVLLLFWRNQWRKVGLNTKHGLGAKLQKRIPGI